MGNYFLISKTQGIPYQQYQGNALRILKTAPATVDEIIIGIKNNRKKVNKLTTFRDKNGNVIERCYSNAGKSFRNLVYSRLEKVIEEDEFVESILRKEYTTSGKNAKKYRNKYNLCNDTNVLLRMYWEKLGSRTEHISTNINTAEKIITTTEAEYDKNLGLQLHSITEYPHLLEGKKTGKEKSLAFAADNEGHHIIPNSEIMTQDVIFPQKDTFLPYRTLGIEDFNLKIIRRAIEDRKLTNAGIGIRLDYKPAEDEMNTKALFRSWSGDICYNKYRPHTSKYSAISTAYHETEHAWQYYLNARYTKGLTPWERMIYFQFGPLKKIREIKEAKAYNKSIENYVPYDGTNLNEYMKNYIEITAHEAGRKAKQAYINQGEVMRKNFPHIPAELL